MKQQKIFVVILCFVILVCCFVYLLKGRKSYDEHCGYLINSRIDDNDTVNWSQQFINSEDEISYYEKIISNITNKEVIIDYINLKQVDSCTIIPMGEKVKDINCYELVYYIDSTGNSLLPGLLCVGNETKLYSLTEQEYNELNSHIEMDVISERVSYKCKDASYYEITDSFPKNKILVVERYQNYSEGFQCSGSFIDQAGYYYVYDLSESDFNKESEDVRNTFGVNYNYQDSFLDALYYDVYYKTSPVGRVDLSTLMQITNNILFKIDYSSEWITKEVGRDAGTTALMVIPAYSAKGVEAKGDYESYLDDSYAKKTAKLLMQLIDQRKDL